MRRLQLLVLVTQRRVRPLVLVVHLLRVDALRRALRLEPLQPLDQPAEDGLGARDELLGLRN